MRNNATIVGDLNFAPPHHDHQPPSFGVVVEGKPHPPRRPAVKKLLVPLKALARLRSHRGADIALSYLPAAFARISKTLTAASCSNWRRAAFR
jgi:hypothetical protein